MTEGDLVSVIPGRTREVQIADALVLPKKGIDLFLGRRGGFITRDESLWSAEAKVLIQGRTGIWYTTGSDDFGDFTLLT